MQLSNRFGPFLALFCWLAAWAGAPAQAQDENKIWETLFGVKYGNWRDQFQPRYPDKVKSLDGKRVRVRGFLIPMEEKPKHSFFLLSAFPMDACFYCGKAGPESVIEVTVKVPLKGTDKPIVVAGTLRLNYDDPEHLFYVMDDGELVGN
jgi:hypothetical protein